MPYSTDPLTEIAQFESGGLNIPNYEYSPEHTASGPWQINVSTWNSLVAPNTGLPTVSYPAGVMSLPISEQAQGAAYLYNTQGFAPWAPYNPQLAADITSGAGSFPTPGSYTAASIPTSQSMPISGATNQSGPSISASIPNTGPYYYDPGTNSYIDSNGNPVDWSTAETSPNTYTEQGVPASTGSTGAVGATVSTWWQNLIADVENFFERGGVFLLGVVLIGIAIWGMVKLRPDIEDTVKRASLKAVV
jgi:hypothetical protein